ncbi:MAG: hypothetical protein MJ113_00415 [Lachnospiraceae bacterium]|nr:hypothetical protein [Lachnospiraceae bacterium]
MEPEMIIKNTENKLTVEEEYADLFETFTERLYKAPRDKDTKNMWMQVKESPFIEAFGNKVIAEETIVKYKEMVKAFSSKDWKAFIFVYTRFFKLCKFNFYLFSDLIISECFMELFAENSSEDLKEIISMISGLNKDASMDKFIRFLKKRGSKGVNKFILKGICEVYPEIISNYSNMAEFEKRLSLSSVEGYEAVLEAKIDTLNNLEEIGEFLERIEVFRKRSEFDLCEVFQVVDSKLNINDQSSRGIGYYVQFCKPKNALCPNSMHLAAMALLYDKALSGKKEEGIKRLINQGFPSIEDEAYATKLADSFISFMEGTGTELFNKFVEACSKNALYSNALVKASLKYQGTKPDEVIIKLINAAAYMEMATAKNGMDPKEMKQKKYYRAFVRNCSELKPFKKKMDAIALELNPAIKRDYFDFFAKDAKRLNDKNKRISIFAKIAKKLDF